MNLTLNSTLQVKKGVRLARTSTIPEVIILSVNGKPNQQFAATEFIRVLTYARKCEPVEESVRRPSKSKKLYHVVEINSRLIGPFHTKQAAKTWILENYTGGNPVRIRIMKEISC